MKTTEKKDQVLIVRVSQSEKETLAEIAEESGTTMTEILLRPLQKAFKKRRQRELIEEKIS